MSVKVSAIVRADNGGLGTLSRLFADNLDFHRTVSISRHPGEMHHERFGAQNRIADDGLYFDSVEWVCRGADVLLTFECWYGDHVPSMAQALGCKTVLIPMYECAPLAGSGFEYTDLAICPTMLDLREMHRTPGLANAQKTFLPIPFDTQNVPYRARTCARTFVHNSGHGGLMGRNNTDAVIEAWKHVKSPAVLLLRSQSELPKVNDPRIHVERGAPENYFDLWHEGDVLLHPTRWDALSLPMQEACAAGMPVMTARFWPHCDGLENEYGWLPKSSQNLTIDRMSTSRQRICREFTAHETTPNAIARAVDSVYDKDITQASEDVRLHAVEHGIRLFGRYRTLFEDLVAGRPISESYPI